MPSRQRRGFTRVTAECAIVTHGTVRPMARSFDSSAAPHRARDTLVAALVLALGAAVALGLARFAYALLLPPMRAALGWSYFTAGAMNTANAVGYLIGALAAPALMRRYTPRGVLAGGSVAAALLLAAHGLFASDAALYACRLLVGIASATIFVAGGLLAAHLANRSAPEARVKASLVLGLYYGGTGIGMVASALAVPPWLALESQPAGLAPWQWAWLTLGAIALAAAAVIARRALDAGPSVRGTATHSNAPIRGLACGLVGYLLFGVGYIGYMTFSVTLLAEQGQSAGTITAYFALLGSMVLVSPFLWAGLLQRFKGGAPLGILTALLAVATAMPLLAPTAPVAFASGALFGGVFLSVVASTTALVRHNLPETAWPVGISAFTSIFAAGQIVGPSFVGWLADGSGGLAVGFAVSAAILALGAVVAFFQRPLAR